MSDGGGRGDRRNTGKENGRLFYGEFKHWNKAIRVGVRDGDSNILLVLLIK